jgi:hypothetical protein
VLARRCLKANRPGHTSNNIGSDKRSFFLAEDTKRFQEEAVSYELRNPGWFAAWLKRESAVPERRPARIGGAGRPRPPVTAWMAFVQATLARLKETHPDAAAGIKHVELTVGARGFAVLVSRTKMPLASLKHPSPKLPQASSGRLCLSLFDLCCAWSCMHGHAFHAV